MYKLILASQSPRRRQLLSEAGFVFTSDSVKLSEIINKNMSLEAAVMDLARQKAEAYFQEHNYMKSKDILVLSADTIVEIDGQILGKPKDKGQAFKFLQQLSGKTHSVITAFCVFDAKKNEFFLDHDRTQVTFRELENEEIESYIATGEPMDKAGGYGIQGRGGQFVAECVGSRNNVVGFPLEKFELMVSKHEWEVDRR